jgi:hypothetical protein
MRFFSNPLAIFDTTFTGLLEQPLPIRAKSRVSLVYIGSADAANAFRFVRRALAGKGHDGPVVPEAFLVGSIVLWW